MPRYAKFATLGQRIDKRLIGSLNALPQIPAVHSLECPPVPVPPPTRKDFVSALSDFQKDPPAPSVWASWINDTDMAMTARDETLRLKEQLILDSATRWKEDRDLIQEHATFIEQELFDAVSWRGGDGNLDPPQTYQLYYLLDLISSREYIDADRWHLLKGHRTVRDDYDWARFGFSGNLGISLAELDTGLWRSFDAIVQSIPTPGGATPLIDDYARSTHFAHNISRQSCQTLFTAQHRDSPPCLVVSSSFMSALYSLLLSLRSRRQGKSPFKLGVVGTRLYFEVDRLFDQENRTRSTISHTVLGRDFSIKRIKSATRTGSSKLDAIYFEAAPNSPDMRRTEWNDVLALAKRASCQCVICDVTLAPFYFDGTRIHDIGADLIQLQSLAKFAQIGTNVAMGGLAMLHGKHAAALSDRMRSIITVLGQHPDPNLAKALCRDKRSFKKRLARMARNARILKQMLEEYSKMGADWSVANSDVDAANLVWIEVKRGWIARARRLRPAEPPYGYDTPEWEALGDSDFIKHVLQMRFWQPCLAEWADDAPSVKTSFGFSQTTFHVLNYKRILIRISCGAESVEQFRELAICTAKTLGYQERNWAVVSEEETRRERPKRRGRRS